MPESIVILLIAGAIAGFIYSMPVAGPISIIVVSQAFRGKVRFCLRTALGAAIIESLFVFLAVYGIAALYELYRPVLPYFLLTGAVFIIIIGLRITTYRTDLKSVDAKLILKDKYDNRGGLRTGIFINLTNPTLFVNWFIASFITLSLVSSIGLNTGGLDLVLDQNIRSFSDITGSKFERLGNSAFQAGKNLNDKTENFASPLILSIVFAFGVGAGVYIWLTILTKFIIKYREKINTAYLNRFIRSLGIILIFIGLFLGYRAARAFFG